ISNHLLLKIKFRMLPEKFDGGLIISRRRFLFGVEQSQMDKPPIVPDTCPPLLGFLLPVYPFESRSSALNASIELILLRRYNPKITPPVIQPVAVYVVNMHIRRRLHDFTMHQYHCAFSVDCDLSLCISIAIATPLRLTQPLEILIIYDHNFSPSKRDLLRHLSPLPEIQNRRVNLRPLVAFGNK